MVEDSEDISETIPAPPSNLGIQKRKRKRTVSPQKPNQKQQKMIKAESGDEDAPQNPWHTIKSEPDEPELKLVSGVFLEC